jgi:hypothetical protein
MEYEVDRKKIELEEKYSYEDVIKAIGTFAEKNNYIRESDSRIIGKGTNEDYANLGIIFLGLRKAEWCMTYVIRWTLFDGRAEEDILHTLRKRGEVA